MSNNASSFQPFILSAQSTGSGNNAQDTLDYLSQDAVNQANLNTQLGGFRFHAPSRKHQLQKRRTRSIFGFDVQLLGERKSF